MATIEKEKEKTVTAPTIDEMLATLKEIRAELDTVKADNEKLSTQRDELLSMVFTHTVKAETEQEPTPEPFIEPSQLKFS